MSRSHVLAPDSPTVTASETGETTGLGAGRLRVLTGPLPGRSHSHGHVSRHRCHLRDRRSDNPLVFQLSSRGDRLVEPPPEQPFRDV